ncbi:MAG: NADH-quinone oxidoreductase subunit NuoE family protein [Anaerolineae bacterium]
MGKIVQDPAKRTMLLTALYVAQEQSGFLSREALDRVAERMSLNPVEVYGTATFYSMYRTHPSGRYVLQVCEGLSCHLAGGAELLAQYLQRRLHLRPGETTPDGLFSLELVECLASCGTSPAMRVNDTLYENLTIDRVEMILDELRGGNDV